jgi:hypothetical protein
MKGILIKIGSGSNLTPIFFNPPDKDLNPRPPGREKNIPVDNPLLAAVQFISATGGQEVGH